MIFKHSTLTNFKSILKTCFLTIDAETELIREGVQKISDIRKGIAKELGIHIPIIWFVRFQHSWRTSVNCIDPNYIENEYKNIFDGFGLLDNIKSELLKQGDEFGWHYHAYNYLYRRDLDERRRLLIVERDLEICHSLLKKYWNFQIDSFRFGWFFIPHPSLFKILFNLGIRVDSSTRLGADSALKTLKSKANLSSNYQSPLVTSINRKFGLYMVPVSGNDIDIEDSEKPFCVELKHDYEFVRHNWSWSHQNIWQTRKNILHFRSRLYKLVYFLKQNGGQFMTFKQYFHLSSDPVKRRF